MSLFIRDFNNDGLEDIALFSTVENGGAYVAFAGKKGKFKKSDFEEVSPDLAGEDLSTGQNTLVFWTDRRGQS